MQACALTSNIVAVIFLMFVIVTFSFSAYLSVEEWIKQTAIVCIPIIFILCSSCIKKRSISVDPGKRGTNEEEFNSIGGRIWKISNEKSERLSPINDILFNIDEVICEKLEKQVTQLMKPVYQIKNKIQQKPLSMHELTVKRFIDFTRYYEYFTQNVNAGTINQIIRMYHTNECELTSTIVSDSIVSNVDSKKEANLFSRDSICLLGIEFAVIAGLAVFCR
eukprot:227868_1